MKLPLAAALLLFATSPALAQEHDHSGHDAQPVQQPPAQQHEYGAQPEAEPDHAAMQHEPGEDEGDPIGERMRGLFGAYAPGRDASGTSWQPDASSHGGLHLYRGDWMIMSHAMLNGVYAWSDGPRGDDKAFVAGMVMGSARRDVGARGVMNLRAMLSPDPFMGANGYPLLFAAGESADGTTTLVDRQHPHDLFMELSASYAHRTGGGDTVFVYAGLPGEPAFGPPAFMHRTAAMDSPEAPITHHWFNSTHITFGVVTAGLVRGDWKIEASQFRGREPDEERYDIETGAFESSAVRLSWNPTQNWALQASWADLESPEALHPDEDEQRLSASAIYTRALANGGWWSATFAFANKERSDGVSLDAWLFEAAAHPNANWTVFARAEAIETDELGAGAVNEAARLSLGAIRDWRINDHAVFGVGALAQQHFASDALEPSYDGDPAGAMAFVRLKVG